MRREKTLSVAEERNLRTEEQLSVFVENKIGRIHEVVQVLGAEGINIQAFSLAENVDFGILRLIVSDVPKAVEALRAAHLAVKRTAVLCLDCVDRPGALAEVMQRLAEREIFVEYMYAFARNEGALVVIKPRDIEACRAALDKGFAKS